MILRTHASAINVCPRLINPVVVSPTIAAVGLSFFSFGFPQVGTCLEIGVAQILLVIVFSLVSFMALMLLCLTLGVYFHVNDLTILLVVTTFRYL